MTERRWHRPILLVVGWVSVGLAFTGIIVPGLPTTGFLIIAAWCFLHSSERAHTWLLENRILGPYIRDYLSGAGMTRRSKAVAIVSMWTMCTLSAVFFIPNDIVSLIVFLCAPVGTFFVLRVPTKVECEPE